MMLNKLLDGFDGKLTTSKWMTRGARARDGLAGGPQHQLPYRYSRCRAVRQLEHMQYKMFLLPTLLASSLFAASATVRLASSAEVFQEIMQVADRAIPQKLLDKAECVVIVPGMKKGCCPVAVRANAPVTFRRY